MMKIKSDFVTNSSSSSFIVAFPSKVTSINEVLRYIPFRYSEIVYKDCKQQTPLNKKYRHTEKEIFYKISTGTTYSRYFSFYDYKRELQRKHNITSDDLKNNPIWGTIICDEVLLKKRGHQLKVAKTFLEGITDNEWIYIFEYGDEGGKIYSEMEYNDIFKKLPNIKISHH